MKDAGRAAREHDTLEQAVVACQRALVDYRAGLLDEHEFRTALERAGLVLQAAEATTSRAGEATDE